MSYHSTGIGMQSRAKVTEIIKYLRDNPTESLLENNHQVITYIIVSLVELTHLFQKSFLFLMLIAI